MNTPLPICAGLYRPRLSRARSHGPSHGQGIENGARRIAGLSSPDTPADSGPLDAQPASTVRPVIVRGLGFRRRPAAGRGDSPQVRFSGRRLGLLAVASLPQGGKATVGGRIVRENPPSGEDGEDRVKNTDARIDAYIAKSAPFARPVLSHLRALVHEACPGVEETMKWSMPSFVHEGRILCGMAAFKGHCTFGFWHKDMVEVLARTAKGDSMMGSFGRITAIADLPKENLLRPSARP
ncbi:MAG: DUF1801 domain-containing protein [Holophagales bacterium]|nr:DUF1801 domain-containing protein [Holophagales bacterium]